MPVCGPQAEVVLVPQPLVQHGSVVVVAFLLVKITMQCENLIYDMTA